jgi:hypothetical protein
VILIGCGDPGPSPDVPGSIGSSSVPEPCVPRPVRAVLHVDGRDVRQVWATDLESDRELRVRLRPGLRWRIDPDEPKRLIDDAGHVATFDGEILQSACVDVRTLAFEIGPEDLPDPNRPPN